MIYCKELEEAADKLAKRYRNVFPPFKVDTTGGPQRLTKKQVAWRTALYANILTCNCKVVQALLGCMGCGGDICFLPTEVSSALLTHLDLCATCKEKVGRARLSDLKVSLKFVGSLEPIR